MTSAVEAVMALCAVVTAVAAAGGFGYVRAARRDAREARRLLEGHDALEDDGVLARLRQLEDDVRGLWRTVRDDVATDGGERADD